MTRTWIFDLDDTLHDASAHIFPVMNQAMTQYIMDHLHLNEEDAHALRRHYWRIYGATMRGLTRHHGIKPAHFLHVTHQFPDLEQMVIRSQRLRHCIQRLPGRKVVFTNAPMRYALRVLKLMGIDGLFDQVCSVESTRFHPKPSFRGFRAMLRRIKARPADCVMMEDNAQALMTAKRLGMKTVLISRRLCKPSFVDARLRSVLKLNRIKL
ncbi:pyrimidine 5'-nucleotidase [Methylobacillus flagellatus]|uniref:pyrimidine 5'-nucleotidase n=1 Tax=Methylobacillus flagellatus TaxID=405 RepID=UPI0010F9A84A|nr:pyrimidine 5'-nucleotidase [Methylobacillus flagellatus]